MSLVTFNFVVAFDYGVKKVGENFVITSIKHNYSGCIAYMPIPESGLSVPLLQIFNKRAFNSSGVSAKSSGVKCFAIKLSGLVSLFNKICEIEAS